MKSARGRAEWVLDLIGVFGLAAASAVILTLVLNIP